MNHFGALGPSVVVAKELDNHMTLCSDYYQTENGRLIWLKVTLHVCARFWDDAFSVLKLNNGLSSLLNGFNKPER